MKALTSHPPAATLKQPVPSHESRLGALLAQADISINGLRPWDIRIHNPQTSTRILSQGSLGLGESYVDGWWDCHRIDEMICRILRLRLDKHAANPALRWLRLKASLINPQSIRRAWQVARDHYDLDNTLFDSMLDSTMSYSCGYWARADNLEQAQQDKLALICDKLQLRPGMRLLDIGCGWGSLMRYACTQRGVSCVGITVSKEQQQWAQSRSQGLPLRIELSDYRCFNSDGQQRFDRVASVGMFEHVGRKNYRGFFRTVRRCLTDDGLFLLHTIGQNQSAQGPDPWIDRYIFPNGVTPSITELSAACEDQFMVEDLHNFGPDYDRTLMAWLERFDAAWPTLQDSYPQRFARMWRYYLMACAGSFRARHNQLWQWVLSPRGRSGHYRRPNW